MKVFVIDQARCNGCFACQIACKDEHCGNDWPGYQRPQPETGHFWCRVAQTTHGQIPKVTLEYQPLLCNHCDDPACAAAAPDVVNKRPDGLVSIDLKAARGCRELVDACPYGAIYYNEELELPQKCDGCAHLVDAGEIPHCVDMCVPEALRFGEEEDFAAELAHAKTLPSKGGAKPRVYYLNAPGLFIAGDVYDAVRDEVLVGATVSLTCPDGRILSTVTDDFGDFWFRRLEAGAYRLAIEAAGYQILTDVDVLLERSLNVGSFALAALS
ncbi:MAG: carboxypeptidase regulatory-like domain-containing protein [Coriobacteriales bacterium]|jgi:Fe-S-cluster-containing dehydrogenase component|nr:carboxypeptidase regulatory-like domain-containing protein [Coriobacteriales bacterium]